MYLFITTFKGFSQCCPVTGWEIGKQIEEAVGDRAEYGKGLLQFISQKLTIEFGKGFTVRNLQTMRQFYLVFQNTHTLCAELSWSHYRLLIRIDNDERRIFYLNECKEAAWSVRRLERQREFENGSPQKNRHRSTGF